MLPEIKRAHAILYDVLVPYYPCPRGWDYCRALPDEWPEEVEEWAAGIHIKAARGLILAGEPAGTIAGEWARKIMLSRGLRVVHRA